MDTGEEEGVATEQTAQTSARARPRSRNKTRGCTAGNGRIDQTSSLPSYAASVCP